MKKQVVAIVFLAILLAAMVIGFGIYGNTGEVGFQVMKEKDLPRQLEAEIIPQYRSEERAIACKIEEEIYVLAMRGEKPTSGYEVQIQGLKLVTEKKQSKLIVYTDFADPSKPENMAQVKHYPVSVVKAKLKGLPDTIVLKADYPKE